MVINGIDGIIRVVDVASGRLRWESDLAAGNVTFPSTWSPDGSRIGVATTASAQPFVLDAATGDVVRHQDIGRGIAFSPDGHTAAVFGADLRIIDFEGGPNRVLSGGGGLFGGGFADEGRIILGLALDGTLQVVDVTTGDRIGNELRFAPDLTGGFPSAAVAGTRMIVGFRDAVVVAIEFDPAVYLELACEAAGRNLTEDEWKRHLSDLGEYRATCPEFAAG